MYNVPIEHIELSSSYFPATYSCHILNALFRILGTFRMFKQLCYEYYRGLCHIDFRALKPEDPTGGFSHPKTLKIGYS